MYLSRHVFQHVYQWNRPVEIRYDGDISAKLGYLIHLQEPYIQLNYTPDCIEYAMENNYLDVAEWLITNRPEECGWILLEYAILRGDLQLLEKLYKYNSTWFNGIMDYAAEEGQLEAVKWLHENTDNSCTEFSMNNAAENGHLDIVKWLHENNVVEGCTYLAMDLAARNGHLDVVKWLHENRAEGCTTMAMDYASTNGHLEIVKFLHHNRTEGCTQQAIDWSALFGYMDIAQWLYDNRNERCRDWVIDEFVRRGNLDLVKWLYNTHSNCELTHIIRSAIRYNRQNIIEWLCEIDSLTMFIYVVNQGRCDLIPIITSCIIRRMIGIK